MKKTILSVLSLIIIFIIPFLPYKKEFNSTDFDKSKVNLIIQYSDGSDTPNIIKGAAYVKSYASINGVKQIDYSKINLIGNIPYNEISTSSLGENKYVDFLVKGEFIEDEINENDILILKVSEWHPIGYDIKLMNTVFWHKYNFSLWITYVFIVNLIFLLYELNKRYI